MYKHKFRIARYLFAGSAIVLNIFYFAFAYQYCWKEQLVNIGIPVTLLIVGMWQYKRLQTLVSFAAREKYGKLLYLFVPTVLLGFAIPITGESKYGICGLAIMFALFICIRLPYAVGGDLDSALLLDALYTTIALNIAAKKNVNPFDFLCIALVGLFGMWVLPRRHCPRISKVRLCTKWLMVAVPVIFFTLLPSTPMSHYINFEYSIFWNTFCFRWEIPDNIPIAVISPILTAIFLASGLFLSLHSRPRSNQAMFILGVRAVASVLYDLGWWASVDPYFPMSSHNLGTNLVSMILILCVILPEAPICDLDCEWGFYDEKDFWDALFALEPNREDISKIELFLSQHKDSFAAWHRYLTLAEWCFDEEEYAKEVRIAEETFGLEENKILNPTLFMNQKEKG